MTQEATNLQIQLNKVKKLIPNLQAGDTSLDDMLSEIIEQTEQRLLIRLSGAVDSVPDALEYVVTNVSLARYNRIADEGKTSASVDGETNVYADNDFEPYEDEIQAWLNAQADPDGQISRGRVRFL